MAEPTTGRQRSGMRWTDVRRDVEALVFAAGEPLSIERITEAMGLTDDAAKRAISEILRELAAEFPPGGPRGFEVLELGGGWVFRTNPLAEEAVKTLFELPSEVGRLSPAAMECLAIVAYMQPVSRRQISETRGVESDSPIRTLLDRDLITDLGRIQSGGGAVQYGTTRRFEAMFGLSALEDLPPLEGFALDDEQKTELRRRLGLLTVPE